MKRGRDMSESTRLISEHVHRNAQQGRFVLTLGGDHSIGIGTVTGVARAIRERFQGRELAVLWIDAHADVNTA
jgi:arginase